MGSDSTKRNVLVILCDQLRADFLPAYGCLALKTPNLDRLAAMGVVFDRAITASPVCAPARASMMTGRYVSDHSVWTNDVPFRDGLEYLAERMNRNGYATGAFGKLHHFPARDAKGFQHVRQMEEGRLGEDDDYLRWRRAQHPDAGYGICCCDSKTFAFALPGEFHYEHYIAGEAIAFMRAQARARKPFLSWVSFQGPHAPYNPPQEFKGTVDASKLPPVIAPFEPEPSVPRYRSVLSGIPERDPAQILRCRVAYAEMIVAIDHEIGRMLAALDESGATDNTTIVFSADHGDLLGDHMLDMKGPFPYQAQLGIPLILANHPGVAPGTRTRNLANNIDIPGTVLDAAGDPEPLGQSRSLADLSQPAPKHPRPVNYSEFCDSARIVETDRYRYCYYPFTGEAELFDLSTDPHELNNMAGQPEHAATERDMLRHLVDYAVMTKGVRVEAHDFVPAQQAGLALKDPHYQRHFPVAFPLHAADVKRLRARGLDASYNEFMRGKEILAQYQPPHWETKE